jgi:hypothetical protein
MVIPDNQVGAGSLLPQGKLLYLSYENRCSRHNPKFT